MTTPSGPPYPPLPAPGSNAIGEFQTGIDPVGTIIPFDWWQTVISQYANSPAIDGILGSFDSAADQTQNFDAFFSLIWNIDTALGYGLDVWGRILGITRNVAVTSPISYFSLDIPGLGFDQGLALNPGALATTVVTQSMTDADFRKLLLAKAAANICNGSVAAIMSAFNQYFLLTGSPVFIDEANTARVMNYRLCQFGNALTPLQNAIIAASDALGLRPAGVAQDISVVSQSGPLFGLDLENNAVAGFDVGMVDMTPAQYAIRQY